MPLAAGEIFCSNCGAGAEMQDGHRDETQACTGASSPSEFVPSPFSGEMHSAAPLVAQGSPPSPPPRFASPILAFRRPGNLIPGYAGAIQMRVTRQGNANSRMCRVALVTPVGRVVGDELPRRQGADSEVTLPIHVPESFAVSFPCKVYLSTTDGESETIHAGDVPVSLAAGRRPAINNLTIEIRNTAGHATDISNDLSSLAGLVEGKAAGADGAPNAWEQVALSPLDTLPANIESYWRRRVGREGRHAMPLATDACRICGCDVLAPFLRCACCGQLVCQQCHRLSSGMCRDCDEAAGDAGSDWRAKAAQAAQAAKKKAASVRSALGGAAHAPTIPSCPVTEFSDPEAVLTVRARWAADAGVAEADESQGLGYVLIPAGSLRVDLGSPGGERLFSVERPFMITAAPIPAAAFRDLIHRAARSSKRLEQALRVHGALEETTLGVATSFEMIRELCFWLSGNSGVRHRLPGELEWMMAVQWGGMMIAGDQWHSGLGVQAVPQSVEFTGSPFAPFHTHKFTGLVGDGAHTSVSARRVADTCERLQHGTRVLVRDVVVRIVRELNL